MSDISELFAKDPLSLTREDRTSIITYYRENRQRFITGQKVLKAEKAPKAKAAAIDIDLGDLDI